MEKYAHWDWPVAPFVKPWRWTGLKSGLSILFVDGPWRYFLHLLCRCFSPSFAWSLSTAGFWKKEILQIWLTWSYSPE